MKLDNKTNEVPDSITNPQTPEEIFNSEANLTFMSRKTGKEFRSKLVKENNKTIIVEVLDKNGGTKHIKRRKK